MIEQNKRFLELAETVKIEIVETGYARLGREWHQEEVCSPYSRLYYVISGSGILVIRGGGNREKRERLLLPGRVCLIPNGLYYDYRCEDRLEKVYFHINVRMQDGFDLFRGCEDSYEFSLGEEYPSRIKALYESSDPADYFALKGEIYAAIARFIAAADLQDKAVRTYSPLMAQLFAILPQRISSPVTIKELAKALNVSESTLAKRFRKETGMTVGSYMDQLLMGRARQLLAAGNRSIGEIAEELGFCDQFYFSRYFRKKQGETPSSYKRRYHGRG